MESYFLRERLECAIGKQVSNYDMESGSPNLPFHWRLARGFYLLGRLYEGEDNEKCLDYLDCAAKEFRVVGSDLRYPAVCRSYKESVRKGFEWKKMAKRIPTYYAKIMRVRLRASKASEPLATEDKA